MRFFIPWTKPFLTEVIELIFKLYNQDTSFRESNNLFVFQSAQAARVFSDIFKSKNNEKKTNYLEPKVRALGNFMDDLILNKLRVATKLESSLAIKVALDSCEQGAIAKLFTDLPEATIKYNKYQISYYLYELWQEIALSGITFNDCAELCRKNYFENNAKRFDSLDTIFNCYVSKLLEQKLVDQQASRISAIRNNAIDQESKVILIGVSDLGLIHKQFLERINKNVYSFIYASETFADYFDNFGSIVTSKWNDEKIDTSKLQLHFTQSENEFESIFSEISTALMSSYDLSNLKISTANEKNIYKLKNYFEYRNISCKLSKGKTLSQSLFGNTIKQIKNFVKEKSFDSLHDLIRNPLFWKAVCKDKDQKKALMQFDKYQTFHIQDKFNENRIKPDSNFFELVNFFNCLTQLSRNWWDYEEKLAGWSDILGSLLSSLALKFEPNLSQHIFDLFERLSSQSLNYKVTFEDFLTLLENELEQIIIPDSEDSNTIEIVGWLELLSDQAQALILTDLNDEYIPSSTSAHEFIPDSIKVKLGLTNNQQRFARDKYIFTSLINSREKVFAIIPKINADGQQLKLSRLLLASEIKDNVKKVLDYYSHDLNKEYPFEYQASDLFTAPKPVKLAQPINKISISALNDYLNCPYRFYLKHICGLNRVKDNLEELESSDFGSIVHELLNKFGESECKDASQPHIIYEYLKAELDLLFNKRFGTNSKPVVHLQFANIAERLKFFAKEQAELVLQGYRILEVEKEIKLSLPVNGVNFTLKARVDRIDQNTTDNSLLIIDYKTSDRIKIPSKAISKNNKWIDFQLPLYFHAIKQNSNYDQKINTAYFLISAQLEEVGLKLANFNIDQYNVALEQTSILIQKIYNQEFWPPVEKVKYHGDFGSLFL